MSEQFLDEADGAALVLITRRALDLFVNHDQTFEPDLTTLQPGLCAPGATFVTLTREGELRGCLGSLEPVRPLVSDAVRNAIAAASRDPRFPPVTVAELSQLRLSITVLAPNRPLVYESYAALLRGLHPGRDGVILTWQDRRGLLLPQVWRRVPDVEEFLAAICWKAQIPTTELRRVPPSVSVATFGSQHFYETGYLEPGGDPPE